MTTMIFFFFLEKMKDILAHITALLPTHSPHHLSFVKILLVYPPFGNTVNPNKYTRARLHGEIVWPPRLVTGLLFNSVDWNSVIDFLSRSLFSVPSSRVRQWMMTMIIFNQTRHCQSPG